MDYHILREIADSWVLLLMTLFFLGTIGWAFRPGSRAGHDDSADIPFRHEDRPACTGQCDGCACKGLDLEIPR